MYLGDVVLDTEMVEAFTILRSTGRFVMGGGWQNDKVTPIPVYGVVSTLSGKDVEMIPEADRIHQTRTFWAPQPIYPTHADNGLGVSDILQYKGERYRVVSIGQYDNRGYYKAIAVRMAGD